MSNVVPPYDDMPPEHLLASAREAGIAFNRDPRSFVVWHDPHGTAHPFLKDALWQRLPEIRAWLKDHPDE